MKIQDPNSNYKNYQGFHWVTDIKTETDKKYKNNYALITLHVEPLDKVKRNVWYYGVENIIKTVVDQASLLIGKPDYISFKILSNILKDDSYTIKAIPINEYTKCVFMTHLEYHMEYKDSTNACIMKVPLTIETKTYQSESHKKYVCHLYFINFRI